MRMWRLTTGPQAPFGVMFKGENYVIPFYPESLYFMRRKIYSLPFAKNNYSVSFLENNSNISNPVNWEAYPSLPRSDKPPPSLRGMPEWQGISTSRRIYSSPYNCAKLIEKSQGNSLGRTKAPSYCATGFGLPMSS